MHENTKCGIVIILILIGIFWLMPTLFYWLVVGASNGETLFEIISYQYFRETLFYQKSVWSISSTSRPGSLVFRFLLVMPHTKVIGYHGKEYSPDKRIDSEG